MNDAKSVERELSPEKTEAILRGAMQEFLEHGYAGARIDKIVVAAGVSKATLYRHFANKEVLFTALIQRVAARSNISKQQDKQQDFSLPEEEPAAFLKQYATEILDDVAQNSHDLALLRIIIGDSGRFPALAQEFIQKIEKPNLDFLAQYFATHPSLQLADPEVAARTFIGTLVYFIIVQYLLNGADILPLECDRLVDGLVALLVKHPPAALESPL